MIINATHAHLIEAERQAQQMQCDELQATGTTSSKVLLDVIAVLWGQIRLLKAVDVSRNFIVYRNACFEKTGISRNMQGSANDAHFCLTIGSYTTGPDCFAISRRLLVN